MKGGCRLLIKTTVFIEHRTVKEIPFLSHFCIEKHSQSSVLWRSIWQLWAVVMCAPCWPTCLVSPSIKPHVGYSIGCVTKKWFSCQQKQPFQEDVSYCLSWLYVIVRVLVQSKSPFSDPPMSCRTLCWPPNCRWLVTVLPQGNAKLYFEFFTAFLMVVGGWGRGKVVEIDESCFSRQKCNWGRLRKRARVFVDVEWELGTTVFTCCWSLCQTLLAIIKACVLPSTTVVSDCCGYNVRLFNEGLTHHAVDCSI